MNSYILTADGRKVTPTPRPLMPDDVLFVSGPLALGGWHYANGRYLTQDDHGFLAWKPA